MSYSQKTAELLARMERAALRQDFVFDKKTIKSILEQVYQYAKLPMPKIVWCVDITDKNFLDAAWAARAARAASAASAASAAGAAWAASAAGAARAASAAGAAWAASVASAARAAGAAWAASAAGAARAARAARAASDYDGQEFIFAYEFLQTNKGNENDQKFVYLQELFLQAKEAGMGYFAEQNGKLYVCPNPVIRLNERLQYNSEIKPSIEWDKGLQLFYLQGVFFEKSLWQAIVSKTITAKEAIQLENQEQRTIVLQYLGGEKVLQELQGVKVSNDQYGELWQISALKDLNGQSYMYFRDTDPSKNEKVYLRTRPDIKTPQEAMTLAYRLQRWEMVYQPLLRT